MKNRRGRLGDKRKPLPSSAEFEKRPPLVKPSLSQDAHLKY